jgi:uncharacterized lipoprotein NlpE involved in copper resistance
MNADTTMKTEMTVCPDCGKPLARKGAYMECPTGHNYTIYTDEFVAMLDNRERLIAELLEALERLTVRASECCANDPVAHLEPGAK